MKGDFTRLTFKPEKHYRSVLKQQGRVDLDADWNEQDAITSYRVETETIDVVGPSGAPAANAGFALTATSGGANLSISAGRAYVDGILCENETPALITAQPDFPGFKLPTAAGNYIAYMEVWLRHITALDDAGIREVALGGPDTCTRAKTVWQVGLLPVKQTSLDCSSVVPEWTNLIAAATGTLAARAQPDSTTADPCLIPAKAGYRRLENQLYRVEIHTSTSSQTTFKWSRDNGSVAAAWLAPQSGQAANTIRVSSAGPDSVLGFAAGQWVELTDDVRDLNFQPGTLVQLTGVSGNILTYDPDPTHAIPPGPITFPQSPDPNTWPDIHPRVRRWDSAAVQPVQTGQWVDLEDGVQVNFAAGTFLPGDYWLIPARTLTANVEWPVDGSSNPVQQSPRGIRRHFCRLAIVQLTGTAWSVTQPCLPTFPPLTGVGTGADKGIHVLDVRTAIPDASLPNDSVLLLNPAQLRREFTLRVLCDAPVDPVSAQPETCLLSLEMPYPFDVGNFTPQLLLGTQSVILPASVKVAAGSGGGSEILLTLSGVPLNFIPFLLSSMAKLNLGNSVMMRLKLKGNFIWSQNDPTMFLDGDGFGIKRTDPDGSTHIGLRLPKSGDGRKGGDFEMWFWVALPVAVTGLAFAKEAINSGEATTMTVTLGGPAPAGGLEVAITDDNPNVLVLPSPVTVPEKQNSVSVPVTKTQLPPGVGAVTVTATATLAGASASGKLTINPVLLVIRLDLPQNTVPSGSAAKGTVTINAPAGPNGATVGLKSSHPNVQVQNVLVPANGTTVEFPITTSVLPTNSAPVTAAITATLGTSSIQVNLVITAPRLA